MSGTLKGPKPKVSDEELVQRRAEILKFLDDPSETLSQLGYEFRGMAFKCDSDWGWITASLKVTKETVPLVAFRSAPSMQEAIGSFLVHLAEGDLSLSVDKYAQ
jgi:hypothetical protein